MHQLMTKREQGMISDKFFQKKQTPCFSYRRAAMYLLLFQFLAVEDNTENETTAFFWRMNDG